MERSRNDAEVLKPKVQLEQRQFKFAAFRSSSRPVCPIELETARASTQHSRALNKGIAVPAHRDLSSMRFNYAHSTTQVLNSTQPVGNWMFADSRARIGQIMRIKLSEVIDNEA